METQVIDDGDDRRYRIEVPNMLDDSELSVYAFRLYAHLKRRAGDTGKCYEGVRPMAEHCKMSPASVVNAKRELVERGFITISPGDPKTNTSDTIRIVNKWDENRRRYQTCSPNEHPAHLMNRPVHESPLTCSPNEHPVHVAVHKKEPVKNKQDQEETKKPSGSPATAASPVRIVFQYWQEKLGHPQAKLTPERERVIRARLKDGYTPDDIKRAIDGCHSSPFHMGQNDRQQRYDGLDVICRNGSKLENFMALVAIGSKPQARAAPPKPCSLCHGEGHLTRYNTVTQEDERMECSCQRNRSTNTQTRRAISA